MIRKVVSPAMVIGSVTRIGGALAGHWKLRKRGDLPRNLWLEFWKSRWGRSAARMAALGLGSQPEIAEDAPNQVEVMTALAESRIEKIRERLMVATRTMETGSGNRAQARDKLRQRLETRSGELEALRSRLAEVHSEGNEKRLMRDLKAVHEVCDVLDGLLEVDTLHE